MTSCGNCGTELQETDKFCTKCGTTQTTNVVASRTKPVIEITPPPAAVWYVTYATGQRGGPFTEDVVRAMIARQEIKITDSVIAQGGTTWVPISQSPFASSIVHQATVNRLVSSTCPRCGGAMAVILRRSGASKAFIIIGLLSVWAAGVGFILIIIGYFLGRNPQPRFECPTCKYKAR